MGELERLTKRADNYEQDTLNIFPDLEDFYRNPENLHYEKIKNHYARDLNYVGNGACCHVYRMNKFVLKLHTPYNKKIRLTSNPTFYATDRCYNMKAKHFLFYECITLQGLAAVQKYVDCSEEAQLKAYNKLSGLNINTKSNCGMDGDRALIVDWH